MVECSLPLDQIFGSLANPVRRDILKRAARKERSIGDIAKRYKMTFAGISKHLKVLEKAKLIQKRRRGKEYLVRLEPKTLSDATSYLRQYERFISFPSRL